MKKLLFIYNPLAGKGQIATNLADIINIFAHGGYEVIAHPTQCRGDAIDTVIEYAHKLDMLVCCGGDGTLDETVTGLVESGCEVPMGYIPLGTTNDFAASLGLSTNVVEAAGNIMGGKPRPVDVGAFNNDTFVYVAAFGLFTDVSYQTSQDMKRIFGHMAYVLEGIKRLGDIKSYHMKVTIDEQECENDYIYGMITNSYSVGGFKNLTGKNVKMDDGKFEVTLIHTPKNPIQLQQIVGCLLTSEDTTDLIDTFKADRIVFESEEAIPWTLDGEFGGEHTLINVLNRKQWLKIIVDAH